MKIEVLCRDGSPLGVSLKDVYGEGQRGIGVGGSELALLTLCEEWSKAGHEVVLYNDPLDPNGSPFEQRKVSDFHPKDEHEIVIVFRTPNDHISYIKGYKVFWSCDQYTSVPFTPFADYVDKVVCISPRHADYFQQNYHIKDAVVIDLPVRLQDYEQEVEKISRRCLFASVPDRGLQLLSGMWPLIKEQVHDASLAITSDYRLWGCSAPQNENFRMMLSRQRDIKFFGALPRRDFVREQLRSELLVYPCIYDELFCITCAEAQVAGAYPITSEYGALDTTNMGIILRGIPEKIAWRDEFVHTVATLLKNPARLAELRKENVEKAKERFSPKRILAEWDEKVFQCA